MINGIEKHCVIKSGVQIDGDVYLTGESGDIYKFELSEPKHVKLWLWDDGAANIDTNY
mgnify:CR=1 FL=1